MTHSSLNVPVLLKCCLAACLFNGPALAAADTAVQIQVRHDPPKLNPGLNSQTPTQPRIVPVDPFITNLLTRPKIHYSGLAVEATRHPASMLGRLFRWNEEGGFRVVSKNYSADSSGGSSRGFAFFKAEFP